ncbi:MAG: hypothetical protein ACT4P2_06915 [Pseudomonadota bacterium]
MNVLVQRQSFRVSDDGNGWAVLLAAGVDPSPSQARRAHAIAKETGLAFTHGTFAVEDVDEDQLGAAILIVANASQRWVSEVLHEEERRAERDLGRRVREHLRRLFPKERLAEDAVIAGNSTKTYHVSTAVKIGDRLLLVEPVINHANAIASVFLKFTDIGKAHPDWPREAVIEDKDRWKAEDVNVVAEASTGVIDLETALLPVRRKYAA